MFASRSAGFLPFLLAALLAFPGASRATPVSLQLTIDESTVGRAVFSGTLDHTTFSHSNLFWEWENYSVTGTNWTVYFALFWDIRDPHYFFDSVLAQHLTAPHVGEAAPGLLLSDPIGYDISRSTGTVPEWTVSLIHPGSIRDYDAVTFHIDDLNGSLPGVLVGNQISARAELRHFVPEPATQALVGLGLASFFAVARGRKRRP